MDKFDDLIRKGEDIKAIRYLAKELYNSALIGGTRKRLIDRVADKLKELQKENNELKQILGKNAKNIQINKIDTLHL